MEQRLSLITRGVDDLAQVRAFYGRLGWRESAAGNAHAAFFRSGGIALDYNVRRRGALPERLLGRFRRSRAPCLGGRPQAAFCARKPLFAIAADGSLSLPD